MGLRSGGDLAEDARLFNGMGRDCRRAAEISRFRGAESPTLVASFTDDALPFRHGWIPSEVPGSRPPAAAPERREGPAPSARLAPCRRSQTFSCDPGASPALPAAGGRRDARSPRAVVNRRGAVSPRDASHAARGANASMRFHARALQPPRASFGGRRSRRTRRSTARARTPATTLVRAEVRKATARAPGESIPALYKNKSRRDSWSARALARNIDRRGSGRCSFAAVM